MRCDVVARLDDGRAAAPGFPAAVLGGSGNCKFLNETDPHPNSELEASKHEARIHAFADCFEVPHPTRGVDTSEGQPGR